ncbi:MAG: A24 family peptidase [Pirellulales bacterium]
MNALFGLPIEFRLLGLIVLGTFLGSLVNAAARRLSNARPDASAGTRPRNVVVTATVAVLLAASYWWVVHQQGQLLPAHPVPPAGFLPSPDFYLALHAEWLAQVVLGLLMLIASLIDIDEKTIPDEVTVPGTLIGLGFAAAYPWSLLPAEAVISPPLEIDFLKVTSPNRPWPDVLGASPQWTGLAIALGCYWLWVTGLLPRPWAIRRGTGIAFKLLFVRMRQGLFFRPRGYVAPPMLMLLLGGTCAVTGMWLLGGARWVGFVSSLVGMAAGGALVWLVRVIGTAALRKEAMGFGDVTLLAMIGSFVGWQPSLLIFFIAPVFGLAFGVGQWLLRGDSELFYGPFLCLATLVVLAFWAGLWAWSMPIFALGWFVPAAMAVAMALLAIMLTAIQWLKR